jgi:hypothetical protein
VIIGLILLLLLVVGMFMDINAALIILAPVLGPLTATIGMDPVHAGIMIVLALNISLMTPPVGACLFVMSSVSGEKIERISYALLPFLLVEVLVLEGGRYVVQHVFGNEDMLTSPSFPELKINLAEVFNFPLEPGEEPPIVAEPPAPHYRAG